MTRPQVLGVASENGKNRTLSQMMASLTPVFDPEGRVGSVLGICKDITEHKQIQKLETLKVLAGGLAHDLNNILSIILGQCDILSENINSGIYRISQVKQIENAALRAVDLCRQTLTCVGKHAPIQTRINLRLVIEETIKRLQPTLPSKVCIKLDLDDEAFEISGEQTQISKVVNELYFKVTEAIGQGNGTINTALNRRVVQGDQVEKDYLGNAIRAGDYACLTVSAKGCGMGPSVAPGIVTSHDGSLQFSTTPGIGTTFMIFFPLLFHVPGPVSATPAADNSPGKGHGTLLLVDDEAPARIIGSALLKAMGFTVMTATGGQEAIKIHNENSSKFDLILLDLLMPDMSGIETYRLLRQTSPTLPIVFCSEGNTGDLAQDITDDPFVKAVEKPYKPDQLRSVFMKFFEMMG